MQIIKTNSLRILIADEGKHIRSVNDVYIPEHIDDHYELIAQEDWEQSGYELTYYLYKWVK